MKKNLVYGSLILLIFLAVALVVILVKRAQGFEERVSQQDMGSLHIPGWKITQTCRVGRFTGLDV